MLTINILSKFSLKTYMSVKWNAHAMTMLTAPTLLVVSSVSVTLATLGMEHVQVSGADPEIEK